MASNTELAAILKTLEDMQKDASCGTATLWHIVGGVLTAAIVAGFASWYGSQMTLTQLSGVVTANTVAISELEVEDARVRSSHTTHKATEGHPVMLERVKTMGVAVAENEETLKALEHRVTVIEGVQ